MSYYSVMSTRKLNLNKKVKGKFYIVEFYIDQGHMFLISKASSIFRLASQDTYALSFFF